jgi:hypothetical protein
MRAAAAAMLVLVLAFPASGAPPRRAALQLQSTSPVAVRGSGFGAAEQVTLTLSAGRARATTTVGAKRNGSFTARFRTVRLDRCTEFTVRAVGRQGSRATLQVSRGCTQRKGPPTRALPVLPP